MDTEKSAKECEKMIGLRRNIVQRMLNGIGMHPGQPDMLLYVYNHPGCTQRQVAHHTGVTAASVAASFKRMECAGFVRRRTDTADMQCNRVYITEKGISRLSECLRILQDINKCMFQNFCVEELSSLYNCLVKMNHNLNELKHENKGI